MLERLQTQKLERRGWSDDLQDRNGDSKGKLPSSYPLWTMRVVVEVIFENVWSGWPDTQTGEKGVQLRNDFAGAKPDVETARKHGIRYVHLPHGYDGISATLQLQLVNGCCVCSRPGRSPRFEHNWTKHSTGSRRLVPLATRPIATQRALKRGSEALGRSCLRACVAWRRRARCAR